MYDPKVRLVILIYTIVTIWAASSAVYSYFFGEKGLDWATHIAGIMTIGGAILGGMAFVWLSVSFITFGRHRKTGFEAVYVDETGTGFNFPVSLSKFMPDIITIPHNKALHPLEAELIGFLQGYRHWPYELGNPKSKSLYTHAMEQWYAMSRLPGAGPLHRAAALAQDLSLIYAYQEKRKRYPYSQFWKRDDVRFTRRCLEHDGMSAFFVSTFDAFRNLGNDTQSNQRQRRALLTALRYRNNPISIPANCDPLAREIYEYLHRAAQSVTIQTQTSKDFSPSAEQVTKFEGEVYAFLQGVIRELELNPVEIKESHDGVYLGDGVILISLARLTKKFSSVLSPTCRGDFQLWEASEDPHVSWPYIVKALENKNILLKEWDSVPSKNGIFDLHVQDIHFAHAVFIKIESDTFPELRSSLDMLPKWNGLISMEQNKETALEEALKKIKAVDAMLSRIYEEPVIT